MFQLMNGLRDEGNVKTVIDDVMVTRVGDCDMVGDTRLIDAEDVVIESLCVGDRCERDEVTRELFLLQDQLRGVLQQNESLLQTVQPQVVFHCHIHSRHSRPTPHSSAVHRRQITCLLPIASISAAVSLPAFRRPPLAAACATARWARRPCSVRRAGAASTPTATGTC